MKYRPDIDGLRACAVLPVVFYHAGVLGFSGGFIGVDVFFVISGYVITKILLNDLEREQFSILDFYERRVRRIFPALILTIILTAIACYFILLPSQMIDFSKSLSASVYFGSNIYFWKQSGYFDVASTLRPLLHLWSLAVEEQFYILMPISMYMAYSLTTRWGISSISRWRWVFWPALVASFTLSVAVTNSAPSANFFLLPTRAWELLLGALLVLTPLPALPTRRSAELCGAIGAGLLVYGVFFLSDATPFPGANALYPCVGAALLIYAGTSHSTICNQAISIKPIVFVGLISYSLYLFHWPLIVLSRYYLLRNPRGLEIAVLCAASFALAAASHAFVEGPFRQKKIGARRNVLFAQGAAAMGGILAVGLAGQASGFARRFPDFRPQAVAGGGEQWGEGTCFLEGVEKAEQWSREKCTLTRDSHDSLLLWGDSFAAHYVPGLLANRSSIPFNIVEYTFGGCPPVISFYSYRIPHCHQFNENALGLIDTLRPKVVILSARWDLLLEHGDLAGLQQTIDQIRAKGARAIVVGPSPEFGVDIQSLAYRLRADPRGSSAWSISNSDPALIELLRKQTKGAILLDPIKTLCNDNVCPYKNNGRLLYLDYGHFSTDGSTQAVKALRLGMDS